MQWTIQFIWCYKRTHTILCVWDYYESPTGGNKGLWMLLKLHMLITITHRFCNSSDVEFWRNITNIVLWRKEKQHKLPCSVFMYLWVWIPNIYTRIIMWYDEVKNISCGLAMVLFSKYLLSSGFLAIHRSENYDKQKREELLGSDNY